MTSLLQLLLFPSSVAILLHHQRMEFIFHNSHVILDLLPRTFLFSWQGTGPDAKAAQTRLRCSYVIAAKIPRSLSHYGWPLRNIHISFHLSLPRLLPERVEYMRNTAGAFARGALVGSVLLIYLVVCAFLLSVFTFWVPCCDVRYDFPHMHDARFVFTSSPVVCRRLVSYYRYFCWFAQIGVLHILYCVFLRLVYPMLPVSLDCLFSSVPLIFSNVYLR